MVGFQMGTEGFYSLDDLRNSDLPMCDTLSVVNVASTHVHCFRSSTFGCLPQLSPVYTNEVHGLRDTTPILLVYFQHPQVRLYLSPKVKPIPRARFLPELLLPEHHAREEKGSYTHFWEMMRGIILRLGSDEAVTGQ